MTTRLFHLAGALLLLGTSGCATILTSKPDTLADKPKGIRIYPIRVYVLVDAKVPETDVLTLPDIAHPYDVRPLTILAKQEFKIELEEGTVTALTSNQDTSGFLEFLKTAAELAAKAGGIGVGKQSFNAAFGLPSGLYVLEGDQLKPVFHP